MERFGADGVPALAEALGLPVRTWLNYESGVIMPGTILLGFIDLVGVDPRWLGTGEGEPYAEEGTPSHSLRRSGA